MEFEAALNLIRSDLKMSITRKGWGYDLKFDAKYGYLMLWHKDELTPYTISIYDFNYDWIIKK